MMTRIPSPDQLAEYLDTVGMRGQVGRFNPQQIAQRSTWAVVPDAEVTDYAMAVIRMLPDNFSTVTAINPLDPASGFYRENTDCGCEHTIPAGRT